MAVSALGFSAMAVLVKLASAHLPIGEIVLGRAVVTLVLSYAMVRRAALSPWGNRHGTLAFRGVLGFLALAGWYIALARLPLADATTLQNTTPLVTALLAWRLLGERVGWAAGFAIACGLVGVVMVAQPSGASDPLGVAVALGGAAVTSIAYVTVRELSKTEHPLVIVLWFPLIATPAALPWALHDFRWPTPIEWLLLAGVGATTQIGQLFMTMGLAVERAGRATAVGYLQVAFAMLWQLVVFGVPPAWSTISGAALIIAGTIAVTVTAEPAPRMPT